MTGVKSIKDIVERLGARTDVSDAEINRLYRALVKRTHPDVPGGDEEAFRFLTEAFTELRSRVSIHRHKERLFAGLDPHQISEEMGWGRNENPRSNLFICLERFFSLGLHRQRVRSRETVRKRADLVIRSVLYWSYEHDRTFVDLFSSFLRQQGNFAITDRLAKRYFLVRRIALRGVVWFLRYQESGRAGAARIARDHLSYARQIGVVARQDDFAVLDAFSAWFSRELEAPPEAYGAKQFSM